MDDVPLPLPDVLTPREVEVFVAEQAEAIRVLGRRVVGDIIEIGQRLIAVKEKLGHGARLPWLDREFGWSEQAIAVAVERATQLLSHDNDALRREPEPLHP